MDVVGPPLSSMCAKIEMPSSWYAKFQKVHAISFSSLHDCIFLSIHNLHKGIIIQSLLQREESMQKKFKISGSKLIPH